ncbi:MAG: metal ABC transporter ATP-binding protein [Cyanobacteria bacterium J06627_8]
MNNPILVVNGLTVHREAYLAVQDASFVIEPGTDTAIIGPNGAGKSTLIQAVLGILPRQAGEVFVLGHPLSAKGHLATEVRQQIAYLPQNFLLDRRIPIIVSELVGLGWDRVGPQMPWAGGRARHRAVRDALNQVEAWHLRNQLVSSLSGGETKRVLLAYCLVRPRRLLILDEAPAGLDVRSESEFYKVLYQLKQEQGWAILQVSHDLDMVRRSCDRVLCMNRTLLCQGTPDHALTTENLSLAYGPEFVRYRHSC